MIRILVFAVLVLALGFGFSWLADRPGELSILWQGKLVEMSLLVAASLVVALVAAVMIAGLIWSVISTAPVKVGGPGVLLSPAGVASVTAPDGSGRKASPARPTTSVRNTSAIARCWPRPPARLPRSGLMLMTRSLPARSSPACWSTIREKPPADRHRLSACRRGQEGQGRDVRPRLAVHGQV